MHSWRRGCNVRRARKPDRATERTYFTEFRQLIGTPEYTSPEQAAAGRRSRQVQAADLAGQTLWIDGYNVLHAGLLNREDRARFWSRAHRDRL